MENRTQPSWFELFHHLQSREPIESHSRRGTIRSSPQFAIDYSCFRQTTVNKEHNRLLVW